MTLQQAAPARSDATPTRQVDFYFDPSCPWAWRTSLWIREVRQVRPIEVTWKFLSLAEINKENDYAAESHGHSHATFRLFALARDTSGNDAVDRLYLALGQASHDRKESLGDPAVIDRALSEASLDPAWRTEVAGRQDLEDRVLAEHRDGVERVGGFGVPTISVEGARGFYGPVISEVPTGEAAGILWDHMAYLAEQPYFFEYKRSRK